MFFLMRLAEILVDAPADKVWQVLAGGSWVSSATRGEIDAGSVTVVESHAPRRLVLRAPANGTATVRIEVTVDARGAKTLVQRGADVCGGNGVLPALAAALLDEARATWSLERLATLVER
jgi:hypothetical protein